MQNANGDNAAVVRRMRRLLNEGMDVRLALAQRIRRSIDGQTYENDLKLEIAIDRMLDELDDVRGKEERR